MSAPVTPALAVADAAAFLYREADCLDQRRWDEWLTLYTEDAVFWLPAWKSEDQQTNDPDTELSLIYYAGRARLGGVPSSRPAIARHKQVG